MNLCKQPVDRFEILQIVDGSFHFSVRQTQIVIPAVALLQRIVTVRIVGLLRNSSLRRGLARAGSD